MLYNSSLDTRLVVWMGCSLRRNVKDRIWLQCEWQLFYDAVSPTDGEMVPQLLKHINFFNHFQEQASRLWILCCAFQRVALRNQHFLYASKRPKVIRHKRALTHRRSWCDSHLTLSQGVVNREKNTASELAWRDLHKTKRLADVQKCTV